LYGFFDVVEGAHSYTLYLKRIHVKNLRYTINSVYTKIKPNKFVVKKINVGLQFLFSGERIHVGIAKQFELNIFSWQRYIIK